MTLEVHLVVPGSLARISGGTIYDRRIIQGLQALGHRVAAHELPGDFPLAGEAVQQAGAALLPAMQGADRLVIDGLALPAFEHCLERLSAPWLALVHHPLALEGGFAPETAALLERRERWMLRAADRVIVTGRRTMRDVQDIGVPAERIGVVEPGTDRRPLASADGEPPSLLTVGALIPRKRHDLLIAALARLRDLPWRSTLIGPLGRAPEHEARVIALIEDSELGDRVRLDGEVGLDRLARAYASADLFVLPSDHEGYGMALAEAVAHGLPVLSTRAGAIGDTVPAAAGVLVPPDDLAALTDALRTLLQDRATRLRLRDGARSVREHLPDWPEQVTAFARELAAAGR